MAGNTPRSQQSASLVQLVKATVDLSSGETVVRQSDRGSPNYGPAGAPTNQVAIANSAALPAAPTVSTDGLPLLGSASVVLYWRNGTATHTSINLTLWAYTSLGHWVQVDTAASLAPSVEVVLDGAGYRRVFVQVTTATGGATGSLNIYVAGV